LKMFISENPLIDALLRMLELPAINEIEELLRGVDPVEVRVDCSGEDCKYIELLLKGYDRIKLVKDKVPKPNLEHTIPSPNISIGGRLGGRFRFHGLPEELLAPSFMLAIAAAGGKWPPDLHCPEACDTGNLILYVVPGVPCIRAVVLTIELLLCCRNVQADVINIGSLTVQDVKLPVNRVPAFRVHNRFRIGLPSKGLEEIVELLKVAKA
jgi:hypothetical protein